MEKCALFDENSKYDNLIIRIGLNYTNIYKNYYMK